jgi:SWIM zinc finger
MVRMATRKERSEHWNDEDVCPNICTRVQTLISDSRTCKAYKSGDGYYEVRDGKSILPVSLTERTCLCNAWQITGIPCKHAVRAILHSDQDPLKFCSEWYSCKRYKEAYKHTIRTIPDTDHWPEREGPVIKPPPLKRSIGRPARNRRRAADEDRKGKRSTKVKCSRCKEYGHNMKTCKGGLTAKEKRKKTAIPTPSSQPTEPIRRTRPVTRAFSSQLVIRG